MINTRGDVIKAPISGKKSARRKAFGDYFSSQEKAIKVKLAMIRLFKRYD